MSKHRHGLPRKRPTSKRHEDIAEDLPQQHAAGSGAASDGPVRVTCEPCSENGIDTMLTLEVPEMEKKAVAGAIDEPLQSAVGEHGAALRWKTVVVRFTGDALIGSAIKDLVAEKMAPGKPVKVIVRRGYGDEVVLEGEAPTLDVDTAADGNTTNVTIGTGELDSDDLPELFAPFLADIASRAAGKKLTLKFEGNARPDGALRDHIAAVLQQAEALRCVIGARVLFDRELTDRCQVSDGGDDLLVTIDPASDPAITGEAMETVLPDHALGFAGRVVKVQWRRPPEHGEGEHFLRIVTGFAPEHIEFRGEGLGAAVVWPPVLEIVEGKETILRVRPNGRDHSTVLAAMPGEIADLAEALKGRLVVVDWPALFVVDDDTENCLIEALGAVAPKSVCCTVAGADREPFLPAPVTLSDDGDVCVVGIDTGASKPAGLVRAVDRRLPRFAASFRGRTVRLKVAGEAPASRTLLRTMLDHVADAGPSRLEVEDHGPVDVFLPPMLEVSRSSATEARIAVDLDGRDAEQQQLALRREFEAVGLPKAAVVTLVTSALDAALLELLIEHHADSVTTDDGTQLYPEVLPEPEPEPEVLPEPEPEPEAAAPPPVAAAAPAAVATASTSAIRVLAHNDEAVPPTVLLGIDAGTEAGHLAAIAGQLAAHLPRLQRRAVMVVLQQNGQDLAVRKPDAMVDLLRRTLPNGAAATLIFRGPDAQGRPHFQVLHSSLRAMPVGATFLDPRPRA